MPFRAKPLKTEIVAFPPSPVNARWGELVRVLARVGARLRDAEKANGAPAPQADAPSPSEAGAPCSASHEYRR